MNRSTTVILAAAAVVLALALVFLSGGTRTGARRFEEEPTVNLVVDKETGETEQLPMEEYIQGVIGGEMGQLPSENGAPRLAARGVRRAGDPRSEFRVDLPRRPRRRQHLH